ncbi:hypothetical protein MMPV_005586 [Pyropia vietnamensis]
MPSEDGAPAAAARPRTRRPHWEPVDMITEPHGEALYSVAFSPLARSSAGHAVLATCGGPSVRVYATTPAKTRLLQAYLDEDASEAYYAVGWTYNADGRGSHWVLVGGRKGILRVIDVTNRGGVAALAGHGEAINDVAVHPSDPALVLTASRDESLRLWNTRSRSCVAIFGGEGGHRGDVLYCAWDTFGNRFLSTGHDNSVKVWGVDGLEGAVEASHKAADDAAAAEGELAGGKGKGPAGEGEKDGTAAAAGDRQRKRRSSSVAGGGSAPMEGVETANTNGRTMAGALPTAGGGGGGGGGRGGDGGDGGGVPSTAPLRLPVMEQFPLFSSRRIHRHYVDCAAFIGDLILSKSNDERLVLWRPGTVASSMPPDSLSAGVTGDTGAAAATGGGTPDLSSAKDNYWALREYSLAPCDMVWFVRFGVDADAELVAVGTIAGTVEVFDVDTGGDDGTGSALGPAGAGPYQTLRAKDCNNVVRQCAFSPDRTTLVAVTDTCALYRWEETPRAEAS